MRTIPPDQFLPRPAPQSLRGDEIHVWLFPDWPDPRASADSLRVRRWLADYANCDAAELRIRRSAAGKPFVADSTLQFNLSHSRGALVLAITRGTAVGVDIENRDRQRRALELAQRWFDPSEVAALAELDETTRASAFLRLWSCKEAVLKATGTGIANGLAKAVFRLDAEGHVAGFADSNAIDHHRFVQLEPDVGLLGALAWQGGAKLIKVFRYTQ